VKTKEKGNERDGKDDNKKKDDNSSKKKKIEEEIHVEIVPPGLQQMGTTANSHDSYKVYEVYKRDLNVQPTADETTKAPRRPS